MMKKRVSLWVAGLLALPCMAQERGTQMFSDNFESPAMVLEDWKPQANAKVSNGRILLGGWESKFAIPPDFYASADVVFTSSKNPDGNSHAGFQCDGKTFAITPTGRVFPAGGLPPAVIDGFAVGKLVELTLIRQCDANSAQYVLTVNGREVSRQVYGLPSELLEARAAHSAGRKDNSEGKQSVTWDTLGAKLKPLTILAYKADAEADNFELCALKGGNESRNRALNGSFEHLDSDGFPYFVFRGNINMFDLLSDILPYEKQIENWASDDKVKHSGKYSVRMTHRKGMNYQCLWIWGRGLSVVKDEPAVMSVYLKAEKAGFPVALSLGGVNQEVRVGTDWGRYSVLNPKMPFASAYIPMSITFRQQEGTVWADDLQIEVGAEPTPFQVSLLDKQKFSDAVKVGRPADIIVPKLPDGARPAVDLDSWTAGAVKLDQFHFETTPAKAKSEAFLACDGENLYIGVRAYVDDLKAVNAQQYPNDNFAVFGGESVELFFDPLQDGKFYQFGLNAANSATDVGRNRIVTWNGNWKHEVRMNGKSRSVDYFVAMPFADFAGDSLSPEWLINVGRNSVEKGGGQLGFCFVHSYQKPEGWPRMILPAEMVRHYNRLSANGRNMRHQDAAPGKRDVLSLVSRLSFYMKEEAAVIRAETSLPDPEKLTAVLECAGQKVRMPASAQFTINLPLKDIPVGTHKATMALLKDGKNLAEASTDIIKRPYREHATRINRFSRSLVVDGKPHFPFSLLWVWQEHPGMPNNRNPEYAAKFIDFWQKHGFRTIDILSEGYHGALDRTAVSVFLKAANEKGMKVMLWTKFRGYKPEDWGKLIPAYDQPCVISHRVEDEADLSVPSDVLRDFIDAMRPLMPYVPTYMSYTPLGVPSRSADLTPDILMCDPYLTNTGDFKPVEAVLADVDAMRGPAEAMRKPVFVFLIANNIPTHWREITGAEQIAQTYGSVCAGASGLSYFIGAPSTKPHWNAILQLNREILALTDVLCSEEETADAGSSGDPKYLRTFTKKYDGHLYLITCNIDGNPAGAVEFRIPEEYTTDGDAEVMFENRNIRVKDGKFTDECPGHSRHVYKLKLK